MKIKLEKIPTKYQTAKTASFSHRSKTLESYPTTTIKQKEIICNGFYLHFLSYLLTSTI